MDESDSNSKKDQDGDSPSISESLKKLLAAGVGAAFMTEESIRSYVSELRLPKDVLNTLLQGAGRSKQELVDRVGNEFTKILKKIDFVHEASRFVEDHRFKITAEIDVIRKEPESKSVAPQESEG